MFILNDSLRWSTTRKNIQTALIILLSAVEVMQVIFRTEDDFSFISDCRSPFDGKLKKVFNKKKNFYSPVIVLYSSDFP